MFTPSAYAQFYGRKLAAAFHPYQYNTYEYNGNTPVYWRNYYHDGNQYAGQSFDLGLMQNTWFVYFQTLVATEDNWIPRGTGGTCTAGATTCEGAYLLDLFTWLYDHNYAGQTSPVRCAWFRGVDEAGNSDLTGLYDASGNAKAFSLYTCGRLNLGASTTMPNAYVLLTQNGPCY